MPNLAGFDLIIEFARAAVERELLNSPLPSGPNGPANDTLVPPFLFSRNVSLPGSTGLLNLKVTQLTSHAQPSTSLLSLNLSFEEGSLEAPGVAVGTLTGQGIVTAPLYFTPRLPCRLAQSCRSPTWCSTSSSAPQPSNSTLPQLPTWTRKWVPL